MVSSLALGSRLAAGVHELLLEASLRSAGGSVRARPAEAALAGTRPTVAGGAQGSAGRLRANPTARRAAVIVSYAS